MAEDLRVWLDANPPARSRPLHLGWFHLGADFRPAAVDAPMPSHPCLAASITRPTLLMVGTLEPRKGHADALDAMDALWAERVDAGLVLVGRAGWLMPGLEQRIAAHDEAGHRLHWVADADDALLAALYRRCGALLMASKGEGFGLPVVEAARVGLPVITRDLPVFREICGDHALYFADGADLPATLRRWLSLRAEGHVPDPARITAITWAQSSRRLAQIVLEDDWYATWESRRS
jgi:glycosyltransferase involved in cell wall biosynthesis